MQPVEIEYGARYEATVQQRRTDKLIVKPECESLDGQRRLWRPLWQIDPDDDRYPGEWAMVPHPLDLDFPVGWIASGDLIGIERVS